MIVLKQLKYEVNIKNNNNNNLLLKWLYKLERSKYQIVVEIAAA